MTYRSTSILIGLLLIVGQSIASYQSPVEFGAYLSSSVSQPLKVGASCAQLVATWVADPSSLPPLVYADSGKFLNDLGDYNNCLFHAPEYTYFTMVVVNKFIGYQYMGLCAPQQCKEEIAANQFSKTIEDTLNDAYMKASNSTFKPFGYLKFYDPLTDKPQFDWSNYLTIALLVTLVVLGLAGSIVSKVSTSQSAPVRVLTSFSLATNLPKIFSLQSSSENQNLLFLNGARVLSIFWIIFGHGMWFRFMNIKNWMQTGDILTTPGIPTIVPAAYFAVDTFFWIGGFLITIGMIEPIRKTKNFICFYFGSLLHRFIRIWPTYMVAILMYWKIAPYLGSGPIWLSFFKLASSCNNGGVVWNMFFLDNFQDHGPNGMDYCFGWGWYLAVDFQLFIITPFILLAYAKNKTFGWILAFLLFFASVLTAFIMIIVNDWRYPIPNPHFPPQPQFMDKFYYKPYIRASAYMMGIFSGYIYLQWKEGDEKIVRFVDKVKASIFIRVMFYIVGIALVEGTIWIIVPFQTGQRWSTLAQAFYNSLNRVFFLFGMYLCIFAAMFGCKNDPSKFILGHPLFGPLAKVSFCIYLTHFIVIMDGTFSARMDLFWQPTSSLYIIIANIFWSILLATCLSVMIESPILGIEKIFLRGEKKKEKGGKEEAKDGNKKIEFKEQNQLNQSLISNEGQKSFDNDSLQRSNPRNNQSLLL